MNERIKNSLIQTLEKEAYNIMETDGDIKGKINRMNEIFNIKKILESYDELEPVLAKYFKEKAQKEKWEER